MLVQSHHDNLTDASLRFIQYTDFRENRPKAFGAVNDEEKSTSGLVLVYKFAVPAGANLYTNPKSRVLHDRKFAPGGARPYFPCIGVGV